MIKTTKVSVFKYIENLVDEGYREYDDLPKRERLILASLYLTHSKDWYKNECFYENPMFNELVYHIIRYGFNPVNEDQCSIPSVIAEHLLLDNVEGHLHELFDKEVAFRIASYNEREYDNDCDGEIRLHV